MKQRIGSYEVVRVLARGGMAVVYLAHQPALDRDVALKQLDLQGSSPQLAQRFVREARLAAALDHPNIVTLFDFYEDGGVPYIAMEYVSGGSLRPLVAELSLPQIFGVLEGVLAGLTHAETAGIAHRDLKPENVLISRGGTVKIADFGIARAYNALTPSLTSTGTAIGTPTYMAPEQALDEPLGPHTDIYALGVMAYEMLAGRPPFVPGRTPMAILYCHVHKAPPPLAELAPDTPEAVRGWVDRMLAKKPADRPASAAEASQALEEIAVAELGPYWRRLATIVPPEDARGRPHDDDRRRVAAHASRAGACARAAPAPPPRDRRRRGRAPLPRDERGGDHGLGVRPARPIDTGGAGGATEAGEGRGALRLRRRRKPGDHTGHARLRPVARRCRGRTGRAARPGRLGRGAHARSRQGSSGSTGTRASAPAWPAPTSTGTGAPTSR